MVRIIVGIVVAIAVGLGAYFWGFGKSETSRAAVGSCVQVKNTTTIGNADTATVDCGDANASWVISESGGSEIKCEDYELSYTESRSRSSTPSNKVCLRPNLKVGECWKEGMTSMTVPKRVNCSEADNNTGKLVALLTDTGDEAKCPKESEVAVPLPKRNMVYCFAPAK